MIKGISKLLLTGTGKDTTIIFFGTLVNVISGGIFFILAPRILGPSDYGLFTTVITTALITVNIANWGLDTGILRFANKNLDQILSLALKSYLILGSAIAGVGFMFSPFLAALLSQPQIANPLRIASVGTIFLLLTNFYVAGLQAKKEFARASVVNFSSNLTRLLILLIAYYFFAVGIYFLTVLFFLVTIISTLVGHYFLKPKFHNSKDIRAKSFFKYNTWIGLTLVISSIPLDNYFLLKFAGPQETGLYSAPFKLLTFAYQFGGNFTRVLATRFASFDSNLKAKNFAIKAMIFPLAFIIGLIIIEILAYPIAQLLFGNAFTQSVRPMRILIIGFIFFFASTIPSSIILYYLGQSKVSFFITTAKFTILLSLLVIWVPSQKAFGAALAFSTAEAAAFTLMTIYSLTKLRKT